MLPRTLFRLKIDFFAHPWLNRFGVEIIYNCIHHNVAVALFGTTSPAALATTVGVLTEVPVMLTLVKIANKTSY